MQLNKRTGYTDGDATKRVHRWYTDGTLSTLDLTIYFQISCTDVDYRWYTGSSHGTQIVHRNGYTKSTNTQLTTTGTQMVRTATLIVCMGTQVSTQSPFAVPDSLYIQHVGHVSSCGTAETLKSGSSYTTTLLMSSCK